MLALSQCRHRSCLVTIKESLIHLSHLNHYPKSNPTEVNGLWDRAGDDAAAGEWKVTTQTYDWKGRPLVTTLPKLTNFNDPNHGAEQLVTREAEYGGCGCAGGEEVTIK